MPENGEGAEEAVVVLGRVPHEGVEEALGCDVVELDGVGALQPPVFDDEADCWPADCWTAGCDDVLPEYAGGLDGEGAGDCAELTGMIVMLCTSVSW